MSGKDERQPMLVRLSNPKTGEVRFKLPRKGARWQGPVKNLDEAMQRVWKEKIPAPFELRYVESED